MNKLNKTICAVAAIIGIVTGGVKLQGDEFKQSVGQVQIQGQQLGELRISSKGLELIGNAEGCRRDPYKCPAGKITNGIGNTHDVPGSEVSLEQVAIDWVRNIQIAESCISKAESVSGVAMTQGTFDALTSFAFNAGCSTFMRNSNNSMTRIYHSVLSGEYQNACQELPKWVYGGGKKLPGLITRRRNEYARCIEVD